MDVRNRVGGIAGEMNPECTRRDVDNDYLLLPCATRGDDGVEHSFLLVEPGMASRDIDESKPNLWKPYAIIEAELDEDAKAFLSPSHGICPTCFDATT